MNARISLPGTRMAPVALAAGIALALGLSAPVQAQYTYPGTASAAPRAAEAKPARADQFKRSAHPSTDPLQNCPRGEESCGGAAADGMGGKTAGGGPKKTGTPGHPAYHQANAVRPAAGAAIQATAYGSSNPTRHRNTNPSMQPGEACPPGSHCAPHGSSQQTPAGSPARSGAYGAYESYGYATSPTSAHQAAGRNPSVSPVRAGARGALNYGPSQTSNTNFRNSVTGKASGPNVNVTGQQTSFMGPNGKKVSMDGSQTITGPNGQKQTIGGGPDLNDLGGGYGHQKGSNLKQGMSYSADGNGSVSGTRTGSAPGMANGGPHFDNGGTAGVSDGADGGNGKLKGWDKNPDGSQKQKGVLDTIEDAAKGAKDAVGKKWDQWTSSGPPPATDMKPGETRPVGPPKRGSGSKDEADMGPAKSSAAQPRSCSPARRRARTQAAARPVMPAPPTPAARTRKGNTSRLPARMPRSSPRKRVR